MPERYNSNRHGREVREMAKKDRKLNPDPVLLQHERENGGIDRFSGHAIVNVSPNTPEQQRLIDELNRKKSGKPGKR